MDMTLQEVPSESACIVKDLSLPVELERRLASLGLIEGTEISVLRKRPKGALIVKVRGTRFAMGHKIAAHISVEKGGAAYGA